MNHLEGTTLPSAQAPCPQSASHHLRHPWIQFHLPSPLIIFLPNVSFCLFLLTENTHSHPGFCSCRSSESTKRQQSAPGELEVRLLRDRAAAPSPSYIITLHLLITLHSLLAPCPRPTAPNITGTHSSRLHTRPWGSAHSRD